MFFFKSIYMCKGMQIYTYKYIYIYICIYIYMCIHIYIYKKIKKIYMYI